jgi:TolB-like protein/Tfp pilus assembly protein PilF
MLSGRFRIIRFIARGGMGEVYEAEDVELRELVALKTLRAGVAQQDSALQRFKREIHFARQVTHPNVCRIYDVFHHTQPRSGSDETPEKIAFLTMELLRGETLAQRVQRTGPMPSEEALPVIEQMAAALDAAHRAGVIHRDFKSSNVMLVPRGSETREPRVVVTDFGLAHSNTEDQELSKAFTGTGELLGTPAYMAPEQLRGGEITAATDIYAFGIVLFEMLTGRMPFTGPTGLAVAVQRLTENVPSPCAYVPDLDGRWERTILRCLERNPADRFPSAPEVVRALCGDETIPADRAVRPTRLPRRLSQPAVTVGALVLLAALAGMFLTRLPPTGGRSRQSVAVLAFKNQTGDAEVAWLSTALAEMLTTELSAGEKLRTIPGENVSRMMVELSLPESGSFASETLGRIREYLGADLVVVGSYFFIHGNPNRVRVDLRLQDLRDGSLLATIGDGGYPTEIVEIVSRTGSQLRERLGITLAQGDADLARAALPVNSEAVRFYSEGVAKLRVYDALGARSLLQQAVLADPNHALARAALATSWSMLGFGVKAREEARTAVDLAARLSREDRLVVEGRYSEAVPDWSQAAEVYRTLFGFFPDNLDYGLRLAGAQTSAGRPGDAMATVDQLRKLSTLDGDNPRIDLAEARAAGALSDFKRQQELAVAAAAKGRRGGARLLVAGARLLEGSAEAGLGNWEMARKAFEDARAMYLEAGDRWGAANAATNLGYVLASSGNPAGARRIYEETRDLYNDLGDRRSTAAVMIAMASLSRNDGDLAGAKQMHEQALGIFREIEDRAAEARALNNIANILALSRDLPAARRMYQTALPIFRETGDRNSEATVLANLADIAAEAGDPSKAVSLMEESLVAFRALDNKTSIAYALSRLSDLLLIRGDLAEARRKQEEALSLRTQTGEKGGIADSQLLLAQIALLSSSPAEAEGLASAAVEQFRSEGRIDDEASGMAVLARALLAQKRTGEAQEASARADELSTRSKNSSLRLSVAITTASIRAFGGDASSATDKLNKAIEEARQSGLVALELEARLTLGQIEIAAGLEAGRIRLTELRGDAAAKGYKGIADRAAAAVRKPAVPTEVRSKL